ncbi:amidase [soil metagenome]
MLCCIDRCALVPAPTLAQHRNVTLQLPDHDTITVPDDELSAATASWLVARLAAGELSSVELTQHLLDRMERLDPLLHAFVAVDAEAALRRARVADDAHAAGDPLGPLHGLPVSIKDSFDVAGMAVTCGVPELAERVCEHDAPSVAALRDAGAIVVGTTNTPMWLADIQSYNSITGTTKNPWDLTRTAGGSSGGSGAALASGMSPLSLGSDLSGSIRVPSAWCGVPGLKPTRGIVSKRGHIPQRPSVYPLDDVSVAGPMGRSIADLELALSVLARPELELAHAWRLELPPPRAVRPDRLRVGVWTDDAGCPVSTEIRRGLERVAELLGREGATVTELTPPSGLAPYIANFEQMTASEIVGNMDLEAWTAELGVIRAGDRLSELHAQPHRLWVEGEITRQALQLEMAQLFEQIDVLICPAVPCVAIPHDSDRPKAERTVMIDGVERPYDELTHWGAVATVAYLPAVVLPVGMSDGGLPLAAQVIGPHLEDLTALRAAGMIEELVADVVG